MLFSITCLVPYVLSCPEYLVSYVLSYPTWLVSYVHSCTTCLVSYVLSCLKCLVSYVLSCFLCSCVSRRLYFACLVFYVVSCLTFTSLFSLHTLLPRTLPTLCPNMTFCAVEFPCFTLQFFLFAIFDFLVEIAKLKTNIVCH